MAFYEFVFLRLGFFPYKEERWNINNLQTCLRSGLTTKYVKYKQDKVVKGVKTTKISYNVNSQKLIFLSFRCKCSQSLKFFPIISLQRHWWRSV
jgi:hypothetical protein